VWPIKGMTPFFTNRRGVLYQARESLLDKGGSDENPESGGYASGRASFTPSRAGLGGP